MPFVPFHKGSTTVMKRGAVAPAAPIDAGSPPKMPPVISKRQPTRVPKPSGRGPAGSNGYFDKGMAKGSRDISPAVTADGLRAANDKPNGKFDFVGHMPSAGPRKAMPPPKQKPKTIKDTPGIF